jgi:hypothetical protein
MPQQKEEAAKMYEASHVWAERFLVELERDVFPNLGCTLSPTQVNYLLAKVIGFNHSLNRCPVALHIQVHCL